MKRALLPIAILAGGLATRLRPITEHIPKSLVEVAGEPFIAHQLRLLAAQGAHAVVLCCGHLGELIENFVGDGRVFGLDVRYSCDGPRLLGTGGAIEQALPLLGDDFFVLYGDSYLTCSFQAVQEAWQRSGCLGQMTLYRNAGAYDRSNVDFRDGRILVYDKSCPTPAMQHIDYGLGCFNRAAFDVADAAKPFDLASVFQALLRREQLAAREVCERFYEIGSAAGLADTAAYLQALRAPARRTG